MCLDKSVTACSCENSIAHGGGRSVLSAFVQTGPRHRQLQTSVASRVFGVVPLHSQVLEERDTTRGFVFGLVL